MSCGKLRIIQVVASYRWDSIAQYAFNICTGLPAEAIDATVYTRDVKAIDSTFRAAGVDIRHAPLRGYFDIPSAMRLLKGLKHEPQGTVVHVHRFRDAFTVLLARKLARRKDIRVVHTRHKIRRALDTRLLRRVYRNLDAQIFVSQMARDRFLSTWNSEYPFDPSRLHVLFNSIPGEHAEPIPFKEHGPVVAAYYGPLEPGKGLEILIDALYRLKEARGRLRIYGSGQPDYVDSLRRRAQARGVMEMIDWKKDDTDPTPILEECNFGVMPSVAAEPFGVTNLYFLAAGRAIIATNNGAQTEYLRDGVDSIFVAPANAAALGDAMLRIASDQALCQRMGRNAFHTFRTRLAWRFFARHLLKIYSSPTSQQ